MRRADDYLLTFDIDWAPDFTIDLIAEILIKNNIKATWFVTHQSYAIERLKERPELFELGIHPNMLLDSTHGNTEDEVLSYMKKLLPNAISMRTHGLYQTSKWLVKANKEYGIQNDVSLFLPKAAYLSPHRIKWDGASLLRIPYFWEDDCEMYEDEPIWILSDDKLDVNGLKIFDFHPIHIVLNTDRIERYENLKKVKPVKLWDESFVNENSYKGIGPKTLFLDLVNKLMGKGIQIKEIINK